MSETRSRTLTRAISYRTMAVISSFLMVGVASGLFVEISKTVIYYILERQWLRIRWQVIEGNESQIRIITRAVIYRVVATIAVALWVGIESALWLALVQTLLFYLNEIVWRQVPWGRSVATS